MKALVERDRKRRQLFLKFEWKRVVLKVFSKNLMWKKSGFLKEWRKFPRDSHPVRIRNRCELTGRAGSVYRRFRLSRIALREEANHGRLVGVSRSSWQKMRKYFTHLREASRQRKPFAKVYATKGTEGLLKVFVRLGYVYSFGREGNFFRIALKPGCLDELKFYDLDRSFYHIGSGPDWRRYHSNSVSTQVWLVTTDLGILTHEECQQRHVGGRIICSVVL